jgi:hypothetical protein
MEIKELDKRQYILLTLLITFVVSIATGIVTVSLMNQAPKSVPQTINNVIQRTIEKVTTVQAPVTTTDDTKDNATDTEKDSPSLLSSNSEAVVSLYSKEIDTTKILTDSVDNLNTLNENPVSIGQGVLISDIGLILVDSNILTNDTLYKVILDKKYFDASVLKKFNNGFTILKISVITDKPVDNTTENANTGNTPQ